MEIWSKGSEKTLFDHALIQDSSGEYHLVCPLCGGGLLEGPCGGLAQNVKCSTCDQEYWLCVPMRKIEKLEEHMSSSGTI